MALKLDRLSRNLAIIATLMDPRFRHSDIGEKDVNPALDYLFRERER
jgi:hypothetical protein